MFWLVKPSAVLTTFFVCWLEFDQKGFAN